MKEKYKNSSSNLINLFFCIVVHFIQRYYVNIFYWINPLDLFFLFLLLLVSPLMQLMCLSRNNFLQCCVSPSSFFLDLFHIFVWFSFWLNYLFQVTRNNFIIIGHRPRLYLTEFVTLNSLVNSPWKFSRFLCGYFETIVQNC